MTKVRCNECSETYRAYYCRWRENWVIEQHFGRIGLGGQPETCEGSEEGFYDSQVVIDTVTVVAR